MKATKEQVSKWNRLIEHGTLADMNRITGLTYPTMNKVINGENVRLCNFVKVYNFFNKLERTIKRFTNED